MRTPVKIILGLLAALVLAVVLVTVAVVALVDPDEYRGVISREVEKRTGRQLTIDGSLSLSLFPCCGLSIGRTALSNPPGFPEGTFASVEAARLGIRIWPLLTRREVLIGEVRADGLNLNLVQRADGADNWTFDGGGDEARAEAGGEGGDGSFSIEGIRLTNGTITWTDEGAGSRWRLESVELSTGALETGRPVAAETSFRFTDLGDELTGRFEGSALVDADFDAGRFSLSGFASRVDVVGASLPAEQVALRFNAEGIEVDTAEDIVAGFRDGTLDIDMRRMDDVGDVAGKLVLPSGTLKAGERTTASVPKLSGDLTLSSLAQPELAAASIPVKLSLDNLTLDVDEMTGEVAALSADATLEGARLSLSGQGSFGDKTSGSGRLKVEPFSPRDLLAKLKQEVPVTADPKALTRFAGGGAWYLRDDRFGIENGDFTLDDTRITGNLSTGLDENTESRFDLVIDALDLDRYLEPSSGDGGAKGGTGGGAGSPTELPLETLRELRLRGQAKIGRLVLTGAELGSVDVSVSARDGRVQLDPLNAKLYGGDYAGRIGIDATGKQARISFDQSMNRVDLGALLGDFADLDNITGRLVTKLSGTATGNTDEALFRSLSGDVSLDIGEGLYKGLDLWYEIHRAHNLIRREAAPERSGPVQTEIRTLRLDGRLTNGVLKSREFLAEIPFLRLTGDVGLDINAKTLDTTLQALIYEAPTFADGTSLPDLANVRIPLAIGGSLDSPKVRVDMGRMVGGAAKEAVRDVVREQRDRLLDRLGLGTQAPAPGAEEAEGTEAEGADKADAAETAPEEKKKKEEDPVKRALDRLLKQ